MKLLAPLLMIILLTSGCAWYAHNDTMVLMTAEEELATVDSWQVITNEQCGFSISYPQQWAQENVDLRVEPPKGWLGSASVTRPSKTSDYPSAEESIDGYVSISYYAAEGRNTLDQYIADVEQRDQERYNACVAGGEEGIGCVGPFTFDDWQRVTIDGQSALQVDQQGVPEGLPTSGVVVQANDCFVDVSGTNFNFKGTYDFQPVFERIIETIVIE